jgi:hypothetical protein
MWRTDLSILYKIRQKFLETPEKVIFFWFWPISYVTFILKINPQIILYCGLNGKETFIPKDIINTLNKEIKLKFI